MQKSLIIATFLVLSVALVGAGCETEVLVDENQEEKEVTIEVQTKEADLKIEINQEKESDEAEEEEEVIEEEKNEEEETQENEEEVTKTESANEFTLSAKALGNGEVELEWSVPETLKIDEPKGFILVRSEEENPKNDGLNYWFRQYSGNREVVWKDVPTGTLHFRICALQDGECGVYSNDVVLEVK